MPAVVTGKPPLRPRTVWFIVVLLGVVGISSAVIRALAVTHTLRTGPSSALAPVDRRNLDVLEWALRLEPGSRRHVELETDMLAIARKFDSVPVITLLHVVPGALFLLFAPIQFLTGPRSRHTTLHRWSGRVLLAMALPFGVSGVYFGAREPFSGPIGGAATVVFGILFLVAGTQAFAAIRRRDIPRHREWMMRFVAIAYGIAVVRVMDIALIFVLPIRWSVLAGPSFWAAWLLSVAAAEWWIRRTRVGTYASRTTPA